MSDVIHHKDRFYAITYTGTLMVFDGDNLTVAKEIIEMPPPLFKKIVPRPPDFAKFYVVESASEETLLVVIRTTAWRHVEEGSDEYTYKTLGFKVFEVNLRSKTWTKVENLGNKALFFGFNSSFSIDASDDNQCKPNSIYFTDDCMRENHYHSRGEGKDIGVYDMKDKSIIPRFSDKSYHSVMWVEQTFE